MVSNKSICYGQFYGLQSSFVPKAPRSSRTNSDETASEGSKLCAFELLADVADKLLQESGNSTSSAGREQKEQTTCPVVKQEEPEIKDVKSDRVDQGSCAGSESNLKLNLDPPLMGSPESDNNSGMKKVSDLKLEPSDGKIVDELEGDAPNQGGLCDFNLVDHVLSKSVNSLNLPYNRNPVSCFPKHRGNVKLGNTDDDDNSFRCNHRGAHMRAFRSRSHIGYRRTRKMLTSRYRKVTLMKDCECTNPTMKPRYQNQKTVYKPEIGQIEAASKRRKLFHPNSKKSYEKSGNGDKTSNKVKFSIKSFKVPELYIQIPETATIASLKRTVMEAVRTFLGSKVHVGMYLEGKKVNDSNRTLKQTGISLNCDLNALGITLEPSLLTDTSQQPSSASCTASPVRDVGFSNCSLHHPPKTRLDKSVDKNQEIVPLENEVLVPAFPINHNPIKKPEATQCRRIRRPFSVTEVEALVEAVETIGTGRWRDVKLRAFDDVNHRTYVDLKDKWKTLVHTASISAQQRRGEPVPQHLLDRVLAAHTYWSNHQVRQRKHQTEPLGILGGSSLEFVGV